MIHENKIAKILDLNHPRNLHPLKICTYTVILSLLYNQTPVHLAAGGGQLECVRLLLEYGGRHDCKDNEKKSPLDYAEKKGHTFCKNLLAKHTGKYH